MLSAKHKTYLDLWGCEVPDFNQIWNLLTNFLNNSQYQISLDNPTGLIAALSERELLYRIYVVGKT